MKRPNPEDRRKYTAAATRAFETISPGRGRTWRSPGWLKFLQRHGRKLVNIAHKRHQHPNLGLAERAVPRGHARKTNAMLGDVEILVLRHIRGIREKLRHRRIERFAKLAFPVRGD